MKLNLSKSYSDDNYKVINTGSGPLGLLGVAFIVLKLLGYINWSWWWVLAPFWIPLSIVVVLLIIICIIMACMKDDNSTDNSNPPTTPSVESKPEEPVVKPKKKTNRKKEKKEVANEGDNTAAEAHTSK